MLYNIINYVIYNVIYIENSNNLRSDKVIRLNIINKNILFIVVLLTLNLSVMFAVDEAINIGAQATAVTTWVLSDFDDHTKISDPVTLNIYNGDNHEVTWEVIGSRFITRTDEKPYPQKAFVQGYPALLPSEYVRDEESMRMFALKAAFNTKGVNTLELIPTDAKNNLVVDEEGNPEPGIYFTEPIYQFGLYALGILRDYRISAVFEIDNGQAFSIELGNLDYTGWRVLKAAIPIDKYVSEETFMNHRYLIKLTKVVITTRLTERVDDFVIYLDEFYYTKASVNEKYYDGYKLLLPDYKFNADGANNIEWQSGNDALEATE